MTPPRAEQLPADLDAGRVGPGTDLAPLLSPRSIAVIGASDNPAKLSGRPVAYLKQFGYRGRVLPVNPTRPVVQGLPSFPDLDAVEGDIDVALLVVPATGTVDAVRACARRGVRFAIVTAAGFSETGPQGAALEAELADAVRGSITRIVGPNCLGMIGLQDNATATFSAVLEEGGRLLPGPVAFVSQSGAFGSFIFGEAQAASVRMSHYINTGNEADLSVADIVDGLIDSDQTAVVLAYLEGVSRGPRMLEVARRAHRLDKPIIVVKSGSSEAGARAAASHTASLAGDDRVFDELMRETGVVRVGGQEPLLDAAQMFDTLRRARGRRLTILSESGGAGVLAADMASAVGLEVRPWSPEWQRKLAAVLPGFASPRNPVDLTAALITQGGLMRSALEVAIDHPDTDLIMVLVGNADRFADPVISAISDLHDRTDLPVAVVWTGGSGKPRLRLRELGIPCFTDPGRAAAALGKLADYSLRRPLPSPRRPAGIDVDAARAVIAAARSQNRTALDEEQSMALVQAYGIPTVASRVASTPSEARHHAAGIGGPVALKVLSDRIPHKSDLGGVRLGLTDPDTIERAAAELLAVGAAHGDTSPRVVVQQMETEGCELVVGAKIDPSFGPVVVAGVGGIFVEVLNDIRVAAAPTDIANSEHLLRALKASVLLDGVRGRPAVDVAAAAAVVERMSWLIADLGEDVMDVEINPLMARPAGQGAVALDALTLLR
ncbi:acetate--CoA ligase family protein [Acidiferrimicrobium sp. IK]|uniref:acetate--CoA ligase family protein n=1 Tax=Acidiferrimicrobium sp. IK TaxID=2871700 RepID=UPI0021CAF366|nr:acetate--CoA ligase family protein [Acidiferrimicrobium sp. IK]MCU4186429.1 acetate--CoA ligase family protein [Acidiferrimicrobium sp. IK]